MYYIETKVYDKDYCIELFDTATNPSEIEETESQIKHQLKKKYPLNFHSLKIEQRWFEKLTKRV